MVGNLLFKEDKEKIKVMLENMWNYRTGMMIEKDKRETKKNNITKGKEKKNKKKTEKIVA